MDKKTWIIIGIIAGLILLPVIWGILSTLWPLLCMFVFPMSFIGGLAAVIAGRKISKPWLVILGLIALGFFALTVCCTCTLFASVPAGAALEGFKNLLTR